MTNNVLKIRPIVETANMSTRIYEQLKAAIEAMNIYDPDADLKLDERGLSEQFGSSRTPLREALTRLDQDGLVKILPRRGIVIVRKTKREILEMITVWAALESMAARLACDVATDEELAELQRLVDAYDTTHVGQHMSEYSEDNIRFHSTIIGLSRCELIAEMTDGLFRHVRAIRRRTIYEKDRAQRSVRDHNRIVKALVRRDGDLASRLVREHTLKLREHVEKHVDLE
ncbi:MAG: GntR family transcriptional regulator [Alphaproteobacteria bacterium]|nr:GntR family transcriptional regulator [Alphaproteobacteria bacterium]